MIWLEVKWRGRVDLAFYFVLFAKQKCDVTRAVGTKKVHFTLHHQTYENKSGMGSWCVTRAGQNTVCCNLVLLGRQDHVIGSISWYQYGSHTVKHLLKWSFILFLCLIS